MSPEEYLQAIETRLLTDGSIAHYAVVRRQFTVSNAQVRVRLAFQDGSKLEFSEFVRTNESASINVVVYSYHWMDEDNRLRMRWDNAPHYPNLSGFPDHIHDGNEDNVLPGEPMNLFKVLTIIAPRLNE